VGDGYPTHKQAFPLFQDCSKGMAQKHFWPFALSYPMYYPFFVDLTGVVSWVPW
jgi:hypothetical protein